MVRFLSLFADAGQYIVVSDQSQCIYICSCYMSFHICLNRLTLHIKWKHVTRYTHRHSLNIYTGLDQETGLRLLGLLC